MNGNRHCQRGDGQGRADHNDSRWRECNLRSASSRHHWHHHRRSGRERYAERVHRQKRGYERLDNDQLRHLARHFPRELPQWIINLQWRRPLETPPYVLLFLQSGPAIRLPTRKKRASTEDTDRDRRTSRQNPQRVGMGAR